MGSDHDGAAVDRHGVAEGVVGRGVRSRQLGDLAVRGAAVGRAEDVGRTSLAVFAMGTHHDSVAVDGHGDAEVVVRIGVGGSQLGHLAVRDAAVARSEDIDRATVGVVFVGPNHDGVASDRHRVAEVVIRRGVAGSQLGHLKVVGTAVSCAEDVGRTASAVLVVGPDHDGVAVDGHGDAEVVIIVGVGGRQLGHLHVV